MRLNFVLGTAAELIKVYPVIHLAHQQGHQVRVISTGQSGANFLMQYRDFQLPEASLQPLFEDSKDLERASSALKWLARAILISGRRFRSKLLRGPSPEFVVVHGDTLSTLVGAWLGWKIGIAVVHVEAGLRSPSLLNPFPEEITRRMVSRFATYHMAPDETAEHNLKRGKVRGKIVNTRGNTLLDAVLLSAEMKSEKAPNPPYALANLHRFENLNSSVRWSQILATVVQAASSTKMIFIAHPQTRHKLDTDANAREQLKSAGVEVRDRMAFSQFITLLKGSQFLISDGGSNQEECSYLGHPCLLLRESTERREGLEGSCLLSRFEPEKIARFLQAPNHFRRPPESSSASPSQAILDSLQS